ncbi:MAG: hypothetical protein ACQEQI_08865, partial [Bacillota bacterium]
MFNFKSFRKELIVKLTLMTIIMLMVVMGVNYFINRSDLIEEYNLTKEKTVDQTVADLQKLNFTYNILNEQMNNYLKGRTKEINQELQEYKREHGEITNRFLEELSSKYDVPTINLINRDGVSVKASEENARNFDLVGT